MIDDSPDKPEISTLTSGRDCPLAFHLTLDPGEGLTGSIRRQGDRALLSFHGWLDLMTLISELRAQREAQPPTSGRISDGSSSVLY